MANNPYTVPSADFVTTTLSGALAAAASTSTIGTGLNLPATDGVLLLDYDSSTAVGSDNGPETVSYATYTSGTGALTGLDRGLAGTTDVAHASGAKVAQGPSTLYYNNGEINGERLIDASVQGDKLGIVQGCMVQLHAAQTITTGATGEDIVWDVEEWDTNGFHSTSSNAERFTIPAGQGGIYLVNYSWAWNNNSGGTFRVGKIFVDGADVDELLWQAQLPSAAAGANFAIGSAVLDLTATQYVTLRVVHDQGGDLALLHARGSIVKLGTKA